MICKKCGNDIGNYKTCRHCSRKETKKIYPIEILNEENKLCDYGCGKIGKYQFKNGKLCCSKSFLSCSAMLNTTDNIKKKIKIPLEDYPLCACGCGQQVKNIKNKFINYHHVRVIDTSWNRGLTKETSSGVRKQSESLKGRTKETHEEIRIASIKRKGMKSHMKGKKHTEESKKKMSDSIKKLKLQSWNKGKTKATSKRLREMGKKISGKNHPLYIGMECGKYANYDLYVDDISFCEETRRNKDNPHILEVRCSYCGKWYPPKTMDVVNRKLKIDRDLAKFYCSDECKDLCPIFGQALYPKGHINNNKLPTVEVSPELRKMVFLRDNYECQKCGSPNSLECHHIQGKAQNPILANDVSNCITFCKECHLKIHQTIPGCSYYDLRRPSCSDNNLNNNLNNNLDQDNLNYSNSSDLTLTF
jgi:hypothetical protein